MTTRGPMKRLSLMPVLLLLSVAAPARAETAVGLGVALLAREQASGGNAITVSPQARVQHAFARFFLGAITYDFAYQPVASGWGLQLDSHQVSLRAVGRLALPSASVDLELGPSLRLDHGAVLANSQVVAQQYRFYPGGAGGLFVTVPIDRFALRLGTEAQFDSRWDLRFTVGVLWRAL